MPPSHAERFYCWNSDGLRSHINTPKYCCPGCSTRTCSLKCVQRHKEWAQCSGKRDPTAYVKKAQLASASGVDHDYNFIFGIEQSRDRAEERLEEKVKQGEDARSAKLNHTNYRNRLHQARVNVEYAPVGMSRQKLNKTRLAKVHFIFMIAVPRTWKLKNAIVKTYPMDSRVGPRRSVNLYRSTI